MFDQTDSQQDAFAPQQQQQQPQQQQQDPQQQQPQYQQQQQQMQQFEQPQQYQQPDYQQAEYQQPQANTYYGESQFENQSIEEAYPQQTDYEQHQNTETQQQPYQQQDTQYQQQEPQQMQPQQMQPQQQVVADANKMDQEFNTWMEETYPMPELPKIEDIDGNDPQALAQFFNEFNRVTREQTQVEAMRERVKQEKDEYLWSEVQTHFPHLAQAPRVQQTLRQLYAGARSMGRNVTPLQVTQQYVQDLNNDYRQGYQAANTQKTIRRSQPRPQAGGSVAPQEPAVSQKDMNSLSTSGSSAIENAAAVVAKMRAARQGGFK